MSRRSKLSVWMGIGAVMIATLALDRRSPAQEAHQPAAEAKAAGDEHGSPEEKTNPLKPEPTLAIWTLVVFILLMMVLGKFAWKPLLEALQKRESHLEQSSRTPSGRGTRARTCWPSTASRWPERPTRCGP